MNKNKLVQTTTSDGLYLHGYYVPSDNKKTVILHVHGFEGNFYENNFVHIMANELEREEIGFLTVNTRGNGRDTDFNTISGEYKRVGARYELLENAHLDISAWLEFLEREGYQEIILQGHSLGTMKVSRYLFEGEYKDKISKIILLSPFDKKGLMIASGRKEIDKLIIKAKEKIEQGKGDELTPPELDDITLSYKTFISWYKQDDLGRVFDFCTPGYDFPTLKKIGIPTKIIVGSKDEYFHVTDFEHPEKAMSLMLKHLPNAQGKIIDGALHSYKGYEKILSQEIIAFVK